MNPGPAMSVFAISGALPERGHDRLRRVARLHAHALGELQRHVGGEIAVVRVLGAVEVDRGLARLGKGGADGLADEGGEAGFGIGFGHGVGAARENPLLYGRTLPEPLPSPWPSRSFDGSRAGGNPPTRTSAWTRSSRSADPTAAARGPARVAAERLDLAAGGPRRQSRGEDGRAAIGAHQAPARRPRAAAGTAGRVRRDAARGPRPPRRLRPPHRDRDAARVGLPRRVHEPRVRPDPARAAAHGPRGALRPDLPGAGGRRARGRRERRELARGAGAPGPRRGRGRVPRGSREGVGAGRREPRDPGLRGHDALGGAPADAARGGAGPRGVDAAGRGQRIRRGLRIGRRREAHGEGRGPARPHRPRAHRGGPGLRAPRRPGREHHGRLPARAHPRAAAARRRADRAPRRPGAPAPGAAALHREPHPRRPRPPQRARAPAPELRAGRAQGGGAQRGDRRALHHPRPGGIPRTW